MNQQSFDQSFQQLVGIANEVATNPSTAIAIEERGFPSHMTVGTKNPVKLVFGEFVRREAKSRKPGLENKVYYSVDVTYIDLKYNTTASNPLNMPAADAYDLLLGYKNGKFDDNTEFSLHVLPGTARTDANGNPLAPIPQGKIFVVQNNQHVPVKAVVQPTSKFTDLVEQVKQRQVGNVSTQTPPVNVPQAQGAAVTMP